MERPGHEIGETVIDVRDCITCPAGGERQDNVYNVTVPKETGDSRLLSRKKSGFEKTHTNYIEPSITQMTIIKSSDIVSSLSG